MKKILITVGLVGLLVTHGANAVDSKHYVNVDNAPEPVGAYSTAVQAGDLIFLSGQIGINPNTHQLVKSSFENEAKQTIENIKAVCKKTGGSLDNVVKLNVYITNSRNFAIADRLIKHMFHPPYPAREIIIVKSLADNASIEISAVEKGANADSVI